jgi:hypothetical protein
MIRHHAFCDATGFDGRRALLPMASDALDTADETVLLNTYAGDEPVAAARLIQPCEVFALYQDLRVGLPMATAYELAPLLAAGSLAEPGWVCVLPDWRGSMAAPVTITAIFAEARRRQVDYLVAVANTETDFLSHALHQYDILQSRGYVSDRFYLARRDTDAAPASPCRPFFSEDELRRAEQGELDGLPIAHTLAGYCRWGARCVGLPSYDSTIGLYTLPIVCAVSAPTPDLPRAA